MNKDKRIIIVEDQIIIALDFISLFKTNGYTNVSSFTSGKDAIENINYDRPDIALLDVRLKDGITGLEVANVLKKSGVPFIFISAFSNNLNYLKAMKLNPAHIFYKPVNQLSLLRTVELILDNKNATS